MLRWSVIFFIIALVSGALGFTGLSEAAGGIAQVLFWIFLGVCLCLLIAGLIVGKAAVDS